MASNLLSDNENEKAWKLSNGGKIACFFPTYDAAPFVKLYTSYNNDGFNSTFFEPPALIVYATEFLRLKTAILDFAEYLQWGRVLNSNYFKPSILVKSEATLNNHTPSNEAFIVDCARTYTALLVRFGMLGRACESPRSLIQKEKFFPIHLSIHVQDMDVFREVLEDISLFFLLRGERRKSVLLEERFTRPIFSLANREFSLSGATKKPNHVQLTSTFGHHTARAPCPIPSKKRRLEPIETHLESDCAQTPVQVENIVESSTTTTTQVESAISPMQVDNLAESDTTSSQAAPHSNSTQDTETSLD